MKTFESLKVLSDYIANGTMRDCEHYLESMLSDDKFQSTYWNKYLARLLQTIRDDIPRFTIISRKNGKLPFYNFSTLPGSTCPGAGDCLEYCYSFRAWRYPAAFCRQAQNTWLIRKNPSAIAQAFIRLPKNAIFRLYVDGDFSSVTDVSFWFKLLQNRPDVEAYGYSKSFTQLLNYSGAYPNNYMLNVSSGHKHNQSVVDAILALPISRGTFESISIGRKVKAREYGTQKLNALLRDIAGKNVFPCPGKCGNCTPKGHACGSSRFKGIDVVIGVH